MPVNGPYDFRRAAKAGPDGIVEDENDIDVGEWAWIRKPVEIGEGDSKKQVLYLLIYVRDPDCKTLCTVWRRFGSDKPHGHDVDSFGHVTPSVLHNWPYGDPPTERCGFHSIPTRLLGFVDVR